MDMGVKQQDCGFHYLVWPSIRKLVITSYTTILLSKPAVILGDFKLGVHLQLIPSKKGLKN